MWDYPFSLKGFRFTAKNNIFLVIDSAQGLVLLVANVHILSIFASRFKFLLSSLNIAGVPNVLYIVHCAMYNVQCTCLTCYMCCGASRLFVWSEFRKIQELSIYEMSWSHEKWWLLIPKRSIHPKLCYCFFSKSS